jgi:hypothetical protein
MKTSASIVFLLLTAIVSPRSEAFPVYQSEIYNSQLIEQPGNGAGFQSVQSYCNSGDVVVAGTCLTDDSTASLASSGASSNGSWLCAWNNNGSTRGYRKVFARCAHDAAGTTQWDTSKWHPADAEGYGTGAGYDEVDSHCPAGSFAIFGACWTRYGSGPALTQTGMGSNDWVCSWNDHGLEGNANYALTICQGP